MMTTLLRVIFSGAFAFVLSLQADQVVMQNGDTFHGMVLSLSTNVLVLQNTNLGKATLPRAKVTAIVFGTGTSKARGPLPALAPSGVPLPAVSPTNSTGDLVLALRGLRAQTNLIRQVEVQVFGSADPEAAAKFNELLDGLSTGKINLNDLRAQAQSAANQLRSLKKDLGPDAGGIPDSYLAILDKFLRETAPVNATTNAPRAVTNAPAGR